MSEKTPDYFFDPDDWESTNPWDLHTDDDISGMADLDAWDIKAFGTLIEGPTKYAVKVVKTWFEGEADEIETEWFDSFAEAEAAVQASKKQGDLFAEGAGASQNNP